MPPRATRARAQPKAKAVKDASTVTVKVEKDDTPPVSLAPATDAQEGKADGPVTRGRPRKQVPKSKPVVDTDSEAEAPDPQSETDHPDTTSTPHSDADKSGVGEGEVPAGKGHRTGRKAEKDHAISGLVDQPGVRSVDMNEEVSARARPSVKAKAIMGDTQTSAKRAKTGRYGKVLVSDSEPEEGNVYEGKDLDTYDSSFIDDEAVEQSDASGGDQTDGAADTGVLSDADEKGNPVSDSGSDDVEDDKLPMAKIRRGLPSPASWDPTTTPTSPTKTKKSMMLDSPKTPSPQKPLAQGPRKRTSRPSDILPSPVNKTRRIGSDSESDNQSSPGESDRLSISTKIEGHKAKLAAKGIVKLPLKPTPKVKPETPRKGQGSSTGGLSLDPPDTPGTRLANDLSKLEACEVLQQCRDNLDPLLNYEGLPKLRSWGAFDDEKKFLLAAFYQAVIEQHNMTAPQYAKHAEKASRMVEMPAFGPNCELQNLARQGVGEFVVAKESGYSDNATHYLRRVGPDGPQDCAFITFGVVSEDSHVLEPHAFGEWQSKSISLWPLDVEFPRQVSAAQQLFEAYHRALSPARTREEFPQLSLRTFNGAVSFATRIQGTVSGNKRLPRGIGAPRGARNYTPEQLRHYFEDTFVAQMKRPMLSTNTNIPIFDATDIFLGENVDWKLDFLNVGKTCAPRYHELSVGDYVAVIHSVLHSEIKQQPTMQFGLYYVVILADSNTSS